MGSCLDKPVSWVDDEWSADEPESPVHDYPAKEKVQQLVMTKDEKNYSEDLTSPTTEIKIRISKKQLEELLVQVEEKGLPLHHVLADLYEKEVNKHWRPKLYTIHEVPECNVIG